MELFRKERMKKLVFIPILAMLLAALAVTSVSAGKYEDCIRDAQIEYRNCLLRAGAAGLASAIVGLVGGPIASLAAFGAATGIGTTVCKAIFDDASRRCEIFTRVDVN